MSRKNKSRQARKERRKNRKARHQSTSKLNLESLDPRILMDASGALSEAFEVAQAIDFNTQHDQTAHADAVLSDSQSVMSSSLRHELVFIDAGVEGQDALLADLQTSRPGVLREIVQINGDSDGLQQIAEAMAGRSGVDAIHVVSHGESAQLNLGNVEITGDELATDYATQLAQIGDALGDDADILIYGCDVGAGTAGNDFILTLGEATGADVAASDDVTGPESLGGDWNFEVSTGEIESSVVFSPAMQDLFPTTLQVTGFAAVVGTDGTPTFDANDDPGNDSGPNNGIIRAHDITTFNVNFATDAGGATNPTIKSTLPPGMVWDVLPGQALGANSGIFDSVTGLPGGDMRTMVVHMLDISGALSSNIPVQARALGEQNGTMVNDIEFSIEADELATPLTSDPIDLTISSAPFMDIHLNAPQFRGIFNNPSTGEDGAVYSYTIGILGNHPTRSGTDSFKGSAPIEDPFTFDVDLTNVTPGAEVFNWGPSVGAVDSDDGIRRNLERATTGSNTFWSRSNRPSGRIDEHLSSNWSAERSTADSGDLVFDGSGSPGGAYGVTVTGADTDGPLPKEYASGNPIPAGEGWFLSGQVDVWIPISDIDLGEDGVSGTDDDGVLSITPEITNFDPDDAWNDQNNYGSGVEDTANNAYTHTVVSNSIGGPVKRLFEKGVWRWVETATYWYAGDGVTSPGHQYDTGVNSGTNLGVLAQSGLIWGDKIDNTASKIAPIADYSGANQSNALWSRGYVSGGPPSEWLQEGTDYIMEFGTGGAGGDPAGWTDWNSMGDATLADSETSTIWTTDPTDAALGGTADPDTGVRDSITKWRMKLLRDLEPGQTAYAWVTMETVSHSTLDLGADPTGDIIGDTLAATSDLRQGSTTLDPWITSEYNPLNNEWFSEGTSSDFYRGERLTFVEAQARINKEVVDTGTGGNFLAGATATFQLEPTVTIPGPDTGDPAANVVVEDILPDGLTIVPGTMSPTSANGNPVEYCVVCDGSDWTPYYPLVGQAVGTRFSYGDVPLNTALPTITFDVLIPFDAPNGQQYENTATISSPSDPSPVEWRDSQAGLTAVQVAALSVSKIPLTPLVPEDTLMIYEVGVANVSDDKVIPYIDTVDLLPWNMDEDGSVFSGTFTDIDVTNIDASLDVYVTSTSPLTLDSQDGSNDGFADPGVTTSSWYSAPGTAGGDWEFTLADVVAGTSGAPSMSAITGIRVISNGSLAPQLPEGTSVKWHLELTPDGNVGLPSDVYVNDLAVRTDPAVLSEATSSGPATIIVVAPDVDVTKEVCINEFGPCDEADDSHWADNVTYTDDPNPTWRIKVENTGTSDLVSVTVTDPAMPTNMSLVASTVAATAGDVSGFDPTWTLSLVAGDVQYLTFDTSLDVVPDTALFENTVSVEGEDQFGQTASDSDDATIKYAPEIGVSKEQVAVVQNSTNADLYDVTYRVTVQNTGIVVLDDIELTEDLNAAFGPGFVAVGTTAPVIIASNLTSGASLPLTNAAWNGLLGGSGSAEMFDGTSGILAGGDNFTIEYTITVDPTLLPDPGSETNQVEATANGGEATDLSDDGNDPDGDNAGSPGDDGMGGTDDPTPLLLPDIRVAKQVDGPYVDNNDGTWTIPYQLVLENTGTVNLTDVTLADNIQSQLGAAVFSSVANVAIDTSGVVGGTVPGLAGTWTGVDDTNILDGSGELAPLDVVVVTFDLVVNGSALAANSPLTNQAETTGEDPEGNTVDDLSDDGSDPGTDNAGSPGDDGMGGTDDPTPILIPDVAIAKEVVGTPVQLANGNWSVEYQLVLQNVGTVDLNNLQITEDLETEFGAGVYVSMITSPSITSGSSLPGSADPVLDASWDGGLSASGNDTLFNGASGVLVPNDQVSVRFTVEVNPDATGASSTLTNQAEASATDENGTSVTDDSDSGSDPNSNNPGDPGDMGGPDDPTPLSLPEISLAKQVNGPYADNNDGTWTIPYQFVLENTGTVDLANPSIVDNILTQLGAPVYNGVSNLTLDVTGVTGGTAPGLNAAWVGASAASVLDGTGTLAPGDTVIVTFDVSVNGSALAAASPLTNQATGGGTAPTGPVSDLSDDGSNPNTDNAGSPGDNGAGGTDDPTPILLSNIGLSKQVVGTPTQLANGNWSVGYQMVLQNTGTVNLTNLQISEDLEIEFGAGVYQGVLTAPSISSGPSLSGSAAPILDGSWDAGFGASGNVGIFNGSSGTLVPGDIIVVTFTVEVNPDATGDSASLTNQADASGTDPNGNTVTDASDDGADPNNSEDDPTPLVIPEIGVAKQVNNVTEVSSGVYDVQYVVVLENVGTIDLVNLQITEDMAAEFGSGFGSVQSPLAITSSTAATDPTLASPVWDGSTNTDFFDGATGLLEPGQAVTLNFTVRVDTASGDTTVPTDWTNQVEAYGESASGTPTTDLSDDGTNPNTDNGAGTTDDPTPFQTPAIRSAKTYGTIVPNEDGTYTVPITIAVDNTGTADLTALSLVEDISAEYGNALISVSNPAFSANGSYGGVLPTVNPLWTGDTSLDAINPSQGNESLLVGESFNFTFDVVVDPDAVDDQSQPLDNQAKVSGEGQNHDGAIVMVMDQSGSPDAVDPDGNDNDDPAVLLIPEVRTTKEYTGAVANAANPDNWDVTFDLVLENTGSTDLTGIDLYDDFVTQWGSVFQGVVSVAIDDTTGVGSGSPPTLNYGATASATPFDGGTTSANLLNNDGLLVPGEYITLTVTVTVDPDVTGTSMALENQTQAAGDGPGGVEVTDDSDDGTNPNSDNPTGDGHDGTSDDPTPLALPDVAVTKEVFGTPTEMANGNYEVTYRLILENTGLVDLDNLQITEDLETHIGAGIFVSVTSAPTISAGPTDAGSSAPSLGTWDGGLSGSANINMFNGTSGVLVPGDAIEVLFSVEIDASLASKAGLLTNQVTVTADDPLGNGVTDESDDGNDPNGTNPTAPGEMGTSDDPTPLQIPRVGLAKQVAGDYTDLMNGTYTIPFELVLSNTGTVDLTNPSIIDNIQTQLGAGVFVSVNTVAIDAAGVTGGTAPGINLAWAGDSTVNILDGTGSLAPQDTLTVSFNLVVNGLALAANSPIENQANATGEDANGIVVRDDSDDGTDPDGDNSGSPGDNGSGGTDDPTPIQIPQIGLAKDVVGSPALLANGNYSVTYQLVLQNTGTVDLNNLQIAEDLEMEFGVGVYVSMITSPSITTGPSDAGSTAPGLDASWDGGLSGSGNTDILNGTSGTLVPGDTITIQFVAEVDPDATGTSTPLENTAVATGEDAGGNVVTDDSDDGAEADNGEDDPTPLVIPEVSLAKQVNGAYVDNADGSWTIPYQLVLENTGTVDLASPSIVDDISTQLGTAFMSISNVAVDVTGVVVGTAPGLGGTWNGANSDNILDGNGTLAPGDTVTVTFDLLVDGLELAANSPLENQATGGGDGPGGTVTDNSDDGDDPNTTNPGTPGDTGTTDDPTPIQIPQIGLAKQVVGTPTRTANGNYSVTYQMVVQNTGTVDLNNIQITEDLEAEFGVGVYVSMITSPSITAGPSDSASTAPGLDAAWDGGLSASGNTNIFNGSTGTLAPNDTITIQFAVEVNPDASSMSSTLDNTAEASGTDDLGTTVTDESDDGADANNGEDDPTPLVLSEVSLAKQVNGSYVDNADGTWTIPYQFVLENTGSIDLTNPSITDDIQTQLGAAVYNSVANLAIDTTGVVAGTAPGLNAAWNGTTADNALNGAGTLAPGDSVTVTFDLIVNGNALAAASPLENQATGAGDGPGGTVTDDSDDGDNPNTANPGTPGDKGTTDDPTPIQIPQIGLAKDVIGAPVELANGNFAVKYEMVLQNTGTVNLINVQIAEDLETEFGAGIFVGVTTAPAITAGPSLTGSLAPTLDGSWVAGLGGSAAVNIFDGTSGVLVPNDTITVTFTVEVDPNANGTAGPLNNTAVATGADPSGTTVTDDSDDGADPNGNNPDEDGDRGTTDDPTPLSIPDINAAKATVGAPLQTATNPEHFNVTYQVVVENTGNVTLDGLDLYDDIATEFGSAYVAVSGSPTIVANTLADSADLPTINAGWDTDTSLTMFNDDGVLAPGETITIQFVVTVDAVAADGATLLNQVNVVADDPTTGAEAGPSDLSDDGSDPAGMNTGSPGDTGTSDDPTPVVLPDATIGLAKAVTNVTGTTVTMDFVIENMGNVAALNVALTDSFDATFGAGNYTMDSIGVSVAPSLAGSSITANMAFDGSGDVGMLTAAGNTLAVGDTATITATITITTLTDPDGSGPLAFGQYENTATTTSEDANGNEYTDDSQDGTDPDADNDGDPKDDNEPTVVNVAPNVPVEILKNATVNGDAITYHLHIENTGNSIALNVAIQDNLDNVFGAGNYTVDSVTMTTAPTAATSSLTINPNYSGSNGATAGVANVEILDTTASNTLEKSDSADFDVLVTVTKVTDPDAAGPLLFGEYDNTSTVTNEDVAGGTYTDNDPALSTPMDPTANIDIEKTATVIGDDTVRFELQITNNGNSLADQISVVDDLDSVFGAGNYTINGITMSTPPQDPDSSLAVNLGFSGGAGVTGGVLNKEVLNTLNNNFLDVDDTATFTINLTVNTFIDQDGLGGRMLGEFLNSATVTNEDPTDDTYTDTSEDDVTFTPDAKVGVAKDSNWDDATDKGTYTFYLEHFGNTQAVNLTMVENLDAIYGAGNYTVTGPVKLSGPSTLVVNSGYDGSSDSELLDSSSTLLPGETASLEIALTIHTIVDAAGDGLGTYVNQVTLTSEDVDGNTYEDESVDGTDPDPNGDGDPTEEGPSNGALTPNAWVGGAKTAVVSENNDSVTFDFVLEHLGNTPALNITVTEDLETVFGAGNYTVTNIEMLSGPAGVIVNGAFNGNSNQGLVLAGSMMNPGETASIRIEVGLDGGFGAYENQATVTTEDGAGGTYEDQTQDGTDPDPDGDGDPRNDEDPTPFQVASGELAGNVYVDSDGDGIFDNGESPIPGVIVTLTGTDMNGDPVKVTTTTAADGSYYFDNLLPGDYTVTQMQPAGFLDGIDTLGNFGGTVGNDSFDVSFESGGDPFAATEYNFGEAGIDPLAVGKDPFLASAANGVAARQPARVVHEPFSAGDGIEEDGSTLRIEGTNGNDDIHVAAGLSQHVVKINGVGFAYSAATFDKIVVKGYDGADKITIVGTSLDDQADMLATYGKFVSQNYHISYNGMEEASVYGGSGGLDKAIMADSAGNDVFLGSSTFASMREINNAYRNESRGFDIITGNSVLGGFDRAVVFGTSGDDHLRVLPEFAQLTRGAGNTEFRANQFDRFEAKGEGGNDFAEYTDSVGNDHMTLEDDKVVLVGAGFHNTATDFKTVHARATRGGNDTATFFDSAGDDTFSVRPAKSIYMIGANYENRIWGFDSSVAYANKGGVDESFLYDTAGNDVFIARPTTSLVKGTRGGENYEHVTHNFETMTGHAMYAGFDAAFVYDSAGDDNLIVRPDYVEVQGANGSFKHRLLDFQTVVADGNAGGNDTAIFLDTFVFSNGATSDDLFTSTSSRASMEQLGTNFRKTADGYEQVVAYSTTGNDTAELNEVQVFEQLDGSGANATIADRNTNVNGFDKVKATSKSGHNPTADIDTVSYVFEQIGTWFNV